MPAVLQYYLPKLPKKTSTLAVIWSVKNLTACVQFGMARFCAFARVREESAERGTRPGFLVGLAVTGGVITSAGIVLAATFSALAIIPLVFLAQIAFIVAFGVLLDTLVVRSLLVPAFGYDLGRRIWWPSRLGRQDPISDGDNPMASP